MSIACGEKHSSFVTATGNKQASPLSSKTHSKPPLSGSMYTFGKWVARDRDESITGVATMAANNRVAHKYTRYSHTHLHTLLSLLHSPRSPSVLLLYQPLSLHVEWRGCRHDAPLGRADRGLWR